jgi:hypothetical protein
MLFNGICSIGLLVTNVLAISHSKYRRQDGPVDPGTAADCTYFDTAINKNYNCAYFENEWGLSHEDFVSYVSIKPCCVFWASLRLTKSLTEPQRQGRLLGPCSWQLLLR